MWPFHHNRRNHDWATYAGGSEQSRKQLLISDCRRLDVSIHIDAADESSEGVYANLRAVASEAELERRLRAARSESIARRATFIAWLALIISILGALSPLLRDA